MEAEDRNIQNINIKEGYIYVILRVQQNGAYEMFNTLKISIN